MKSPGHQKFPEHKVREEPVRQVVKVRFHGLTIAESKDVIKVVEDESPVRYYFPRSDVRMEALSPSPTTSDCPFKGHATYFDLEAEGRRLRHAVWTYETPYDEHEDLAQRVAFYSDVYPGIHVTVGS